jgi:hypothetical protein
MMILIFQFTDLWLGYDLRRLRHPNHLTLLLPVTSFAVLCIRFPIYTSCAAFIPTRGTYPRLMTLERKKHGLRAV